MDHPTSSVAVGEELTEAAKTALRLEEKNDYSLRVAATYASREHQMVLRQQEIAERARTLQ